MSGSLTIVTGPPGSGKSTAIRAMKQVLPNDYVIDEVNELVRFREILNRVSVGQDVVVSWLSDEPMEVRALHMGVDL